MSHWCSNDPVIFQQSVGFWVFFVLLVWVDQMSLCLPNAYFIISSFLEKTCVILMSFTQMAWSLQSISQDLSFIANGLYLKKVFLHHWITVKNKNPLTIIGHCCIDETFWHTKVSLPNGFQKMQGTFKASTRDFLLLQLAYNKIKFFFKRMRK